MIGNALYRSRLSLCMLLLALPVSISLHAQDDADSGSAQHQTYPVRGSVINTVTHEPVARALVTFSGEATGSMLTDSEGRFEFSSVPAGRCILQARRPGFFAKGAGQDAYQSFPVGPKNEDVTLALEPAGSITGHAVLSTSDPGDGIRVQLMSRTVQEGRARWQLAATKNTNSDGAFRFGNLRPGEYRLSTANSIDPDEGQSQTATRWGFPPTWYPEESDNNTTGTLRLGAGQQLNAELALNRERFYSVTIPVANGSPTGISLQVRDQNGEALDSAVSYEVQRQQLRAYLPSGNYTLISQTYAPAPGFGSMQVSVHDAPVQMQQPLVVLPIHPIPVTIRKEFTNPANEAPQVTVVENGSQVAISPDVNLMLFSATDNETLGGNLRRESGSGDDTTWLLENIPPGKYWMLTYANQGYVASITAGGTDLSREPLVVGPGGTSAPIDIVLRNDTATLSVRLKDAAGAAEDAAPRAFLYLLPQFDLTSVVPESSPLPQASQVPNLPPGAYRVIALDQAFDLEYRNPKALEPFAGKGQTVTLEPGGTENVDLEVVSIDRSVQ